MKYIFFSLLYFLSYLSSFAALKDDIIPNSGRAVLTSSESWEGLLDYVLGFLRDSIFALMAVIAIGMFLFIGWRLAIARWNPEEFKKALKSFIYAWVGIFIVAFAWAIVRLVAGLQI
jgi:hypothetical protein